jgi:elongation factor Ts
VDGNVGVLVEVNAETDFVAKNDEFRTFVSDVAKQIADNNPADVDALLEQSFGGGTVRDALTEKIAKIGENMNIRRFERYEGIVETYIHGGGRIGVIVDFDTTAEAAATEDFKTLAKDIAMQIAAIFPQYVAPENVPADVVAKEKEILTVQAMNEGKPANIAEKMVEGRIKKYYKDVCLLEQPFIKDGDKSVAAVIKEVSAKIGAPIAVTKFARLEKGEGLEKREDNFADEVANMVK